MLEMQDKGRVAAFFELLDEWSSVEDAFFGAFWRLLARSPKNRARQPRRFGGVRALGGLCGGRRDGFFPFT